MGLLGFVLLYVLCYAYYVMSTTQSEENDRDLVMGILRASHPVRRCRYTGACACSQVRHDPPRWHRGRAMAIWAESPMYRPYNAATTQRRRGIRVVWAYLRLVLWSGLTDPSGRKAAPDGARAGARQGGCQTRRLSIGRATCGRAGGRLWASGSGGRVAGPGSKGPAFPVNSSPRPPRRPMGGRGSSLEGKGGLSAPATRGRPQPLLL